MEYEIIREGSWQLIKVGVTIALSVAEFKGKIGFKPIAVIRRQVDTSDEIPRWDTFGRDAVFAHQRGVALFKQNGKDYGLGVGEEWNVRITRMDEGGLDRNHQQMYFCHVDVLSRRESVAAPFFDAETKMWVSRVNSAGKLVQTLQSPSRIARVRHMLDAHSLVSQEFDEYYMETDEGWKFMKRVAVARTMQNEHVVELERIKGFGKLARKIPSLANMKTYTVLPQDGMTRAF